MQDHEKPILNKSVNEERQRKFVEPCRALAPDVPESILTNLVLVLAASDAFTHLDFVKIKVLDLPQVKKHVLIVLVPDLPRFAPKEPFGGHATCTWGLIHGSGVKAAQLIIAEGQLRSADWVFHRNPKRCQMPTFGVFGLGRQLGRDATHIGTGH